MSLDVYLERKKISSYDNGVTFFDDNEIVYSGNITHNLGEMGEEAGIYEALWRPYKLKKDFKPFVNYDDEWAYEEKQTIRPSEIIPILEKGLQDLKNRPDYYISFNSPNGWGKYEHFVEFVEEYLNACKFYGDDVIIKVSR